MKLGGWIMMLTVMILFLSLMGLTIPGLNPISQSMGITINESSSQITSVDVESSSLWNKLFGTAAFTVLGVEITGGILLVLLGTGAVVVGLFAKGYDTSLVILPFIVFIAGLFISTFSSIIVYTIGEGSAWMTSIVSILFVGLAVGFIMSCVDYFVGR